MNKLRKSELMAQFQNQDRELQSLNAQIEILKNHRDAAKNLFDQMERDLGIAIFARDEQKRLIQELIEEINKIDE